MSKKIYGRPIATPINPDKIFPKDVVKTVNGIAPDENGNVKIEGLAQKKEVQLAAEKTVTSGDGGGFPDLNASMVYAGMPLVLYWDGVRYEAEVEEDSSIYYARFVNDNDEVVTYLLFSDADTYLAYAGGASHVASVYGYTNTSGLSTTAASLLIGILRSVHIYDGDQSGKITALAAELGVTEEEEPDTPVEPDDPVTPEVTLSSISATYSGGDVAVGTAVTDLTGIVVTARYSDGSTATITGYTLSGTIAEGSNTITVSYGGKTTTFTVTGVAESGGAVTYSITRNITNATGFADSAVIGEGSELLECYISNDECTMDGATATVTMGGVDITETAWDNGVVNIAEVTGDVVITLDAVKIQYVVPPIEDFSVQVHDGALLLKEYTGTEKAIELPTVVTYDGTEYKAETNKLKLYTLALSDSVEHFKDPGLPFFSSRYKNTGKTKTFLAKGYFMTAKDNTNIEKPPVSKASDLAAFSSSDNSNFGNTAIRTAQQLEYPSAQTSLTCLFYNCTKLVDGGTIPTQINNIRFLFSGCTNLRRARIEGLEFTDTTDWAYGVKKLELTCHIASSLFEGLRYNPEINWTFKDIDGGVINRILCFGDSLSAKTYEADMVSLCPMNAMVNALGDGGYTSEQIYQKMVNGTYDKRLKDSIVVIWHGTNGYGTDGYDGVTAKMVAALNGNQRYLLIPPTSEGVGDEVYESWVATYGEEHVLSMGDWFENNGYTVSEYQTDGTHFNADGYALVAQAVHEKIQRWL